ncbi:MAG TPA: signal recognition particle-docking protein FtsY [bacterium]
MLGRLKLALAKISGIFDRTRGAELAAIEEILLQADVGTACTKLIMDRISSASQKDKAFKETVSKLINLPPPVVDNIPPRIIMISGVNGSGKTTTLAKLAWLYRQRGSVLLTSADTYRDAASEQLSIWAERAQVEVVRSRRGQDAGAVVFDALAKAKSQSIDAVLIDTAGRLHTRIDLIDELKKIRRVTMKCKPSGPDLNLLTIDATLGQNSIQQARVFKQELGVNGIVLTKFDGTAKGGAIIPICHELGLPILFLGIGEGLEDILEFNAADFVATLFEGT